MKSPDSTSKPVPDPTKLTTDAVVLLKEQLTDTFNIKVQGLKELIEERFRRVDVEFAHAENAVKLQNISNTLATDKAAASFTKQLDGLDEKIIDLKERMSQLTSSNWSAVGGYIVGALGVIAVVSTLLMK